MTVTQNQSIWIDSLAAQHSPEARKACSRFILAAPHDDGMNTTQNVDVVVNGLHADDLWKMSDHSLEVQWFKNILPSETLLHMIPNIVYGLAVTQKATILGMLALRAHYFEFVPSGLPHIAFQRHISP